MVLKSRCPLLNPACLAPIPHISTHFHPTVGFGHSHEGSLLVSGALQSTRGPQQCADACALFLAPAVRACCLCPWFEVHPPVRRFCISHYTPSVPSRNSSWFCQFSRTRKWILEMSQKADAFQALLRTVREETTHPWEPTVRGWAEEDGPGRA